MYDKDGNGHLDKKELALLMMDLNDGARGWRDTLVCWGNPTFNHQCTAVGLCVLMEEGAGIRTLKGLCLML